MDRWQDLQEKMRILRIEIKHVEIELGVRQDYD